jgi:ComF family protein
VLGHLCCQRCQVRLPNTHTARCRHCGLTLGPRLQRFGWGLCRHCRQHQPDTAHTPLRTLVCADYSPPINNWIQALKYGQNPSWAKGLGQWLAACLHAQQTHAYCPRPTVLMPVPSHPAKVQKRGYNQAQLLARVMGQQLGLAVDTHTLMRTSHTTAQADLGREGRWHNLHGAFACTRPVPQGVVVALVDDVITTGATLDRCEEALRKAAQDSNLSVMRLAIARTPE